MNKIFYKDIRLSIHPFFFVLPVLTGALFLIPKWPYFIALMYFFWISVPNIFSTFNVQNDFGFSAIMPVSKKEIVGGKMLSFIFLEVLHLAAGAVFAVIHNMIFGLDNFALNLNMAFFGAAFIMFGLFNLVYFPGYFRTAFKYGLPLILGVLVTLVFVCAVEFSVMVSSGAARLMEGTSSGMQMVQFGVLIAGIILFTLFSLAAARISVKRFEQVDL